jgi:hypothetical protein
MTQRKGPRVVSEIIKDDQVIFVASDTEYRGGPEITVDEIKG